MGVAAGGATEIKQAIADRKPKFVVARMGGEAAAYPGASLAPFLTVLPDDVSMPV
jgi:hypothetical protein